MVRALMMLAVTGLLMGCGQVDTGERGLFWNWGKLDQESYKPGLYFYNPISTTMRTVNVKTLKFEAKKLEAATSDIQEIHADMVVNYSVLPDKAHLLIGQVNDYEATVLAPAVVEALKAATAHFAIDKVIKDRVKLRDEILINLRERMGSYFINVEGVALTNFGFSQGFTQAVERKQIEEQRVQEAEYRRQQALKNADAAVALADGQAKSNKLLAESLKQSPETIEFRRLEVREKEIAKWNGVLPTTIFGSATTPIVQVK